MDASEKDYLAKFEKKEAQMIKEAQRIVDISEFEPTVGALNYIHMTVPEREYIFHAEQAFGLYDGFLPAGETCIIASPGGTGKTYLLLQAAIAASCGANFLHTKALKPVQVLYLAAEENEFELARRLQSVLKSMNLYEHQDRLELVNNNLRLFSRLGMNERFIDDDNKPTEVFLKLKQFLNTYPDIKLVILDPASKYMGPEVEKDSAKAQDWINLLAQLTLTKGKPSVLMAHHTRKDTQNQKSIFKACDKDKAPDLDADSIRGSGGIVNGFRWAMVLAKRQYDDNTEKTFLKVVKTNYTKSSGILTFEPDKNHAGILKFKEIVKETNKQEYKTENKKEHHKEDIYNPVYKEENNYDEFLLFNDE